MAKSGRTLVTDLAPDVLYTGSAPDIRQLFSILLDNAGKYCDPAGEVRLSLSGGRHPVLTVDNTFAAVGETDLSRLFDRFYRADPARTAGGGWGIGLSIAQAIAARHHGDITVQAWAVIPSAFVSACSTEKQSLPRPKAGEGSSI